MVMRALTRKAIREVKLLRGQLVAIILLVAAGSATFIMMRSMHASLIRSLASYYQSQNYPDLFVDVKQAPDQLLDDLQAAHGVRDVQLRVRQRISIDIPDLDETASAEVLSLPESHHDLSSIYVTSGRIPDRDAPDQIVLYAPFAEANDLHVGDSITMLINGTRLRACIAGTGISPEFLIIMSPGTLMLDNKRNAVVWMHHEALSARFDMTGGWNSALIRLHPNTDIDRSRRSVDGMVATFGSFGATTRNEQMSHRFITDEIRQNEVSALIIPMIIYGVAVFLLNVSMNRLVLTQRGIIAILRAFGYTRSAIVLHYLVTSSVIVVVGTLLGMGIGYVGGVNLAAWYMEFYRFPRLLFTIPPAVWGTSFVIAIVAAAIGAGSAIRSVIRLQPADAMRPPSPKSFRPRIITKLTSTLKIPVMNRLMLQNIDRRLGQTALVLIMIALATSIIVIARYMNDAMDHMMRVEYDRGKLADATLTFASAIPEQEAMALERLRGVRRAEPYRLIVVDVLGRNETYRTMLTSRSPQSHVMYIVDQMGRSQKPPRQGVLMTEYLSRRLGLNVGDTVRMVLLETGRDTISISLAGTVREALGSQCYATNETIAALGNEEPLANGAFISITPQTQTSVQRQLKERPSIIGVLLRDVAIRSFRDVYGANVLVVASYLLVLACLVSVGVLYNNARIMMAERSVELASLRIQGFRIAEVTRLVLGEQGVVLLAGIPIGLAFGALLCYVITQQVEADVLRLPFVISQKTLVISSGVIVGVSLAVALRIYQMIRRLDLITVLKERV